MEQRKAYGPQLRSIRVRCLSDWRYFNRLGAFYAPPQGLCSEFIRAHLELKNKFALPYNLKKLFFISHPKVGRIFVKDASKYIPLPLLPQSLRPLVGCRNWQRE